MTKEDKGDVAVADTRQPAGQLKPLGCSDEDEFNRDLVVSTVLALPRSASPDVAGVTASSLLLIKSGDAVEGLLAAQLLAASEASFELFRRAWSSPSIEVREKYLNLANKTARTVAVLTDTLNRHRARSVQPITRNVTVTGGAQAVVADTIIAGGSQSEA